MPSQGYGELGCGSCLKCVSPSGPARHRRKQDNTQKLCMPHALRHLAFCKARKIYEKERQQAPHKRKRSGTRRAAGARAVGRSRAGTCACACSCSAARRSSNRTIPAPQQVPKLATSAATAYRAVSPWATRLQQVLEQAVQQRVLRQLRTQARLAAQRQHGADAGDGLQQHPGRGRRLRYRPEAVPCAYIYCGSGYDVGFARHIHSTLAGAPCSCGLLHCEIPI